jgi:hypothetical protein
VHGGRVVTATPASRGKGLLLVTMEPPADLEGEFNDWYDTEHFPQRRALPGFESASRWVCLEGWPRWLALYDLASPSALETDAYRAVSGPNSTPWSRRILPRTVGRMRVVAEQVVPGSAPALAPQRVSRLLLARYPEASHRAKDIAQALAHALKDAGLLQIRLFAGLNPAGSELWAIAEFGRPVTATMLAGAAASAAGCGADIFNLYAPYRRD